MNTKDNLGKFNLKSYVDIFLGYSNTSKTYRVYNKISLVAKESIHVMFDESNFSSMKKVVVDDDAYEELQKQKVFKRQTRWFTGKNQDEQQEKQVKQIQNEGNSQTLSKELRYVSSHPKDLILGDPSWGVTTR